MACRNCCCDHSGQTAENGRSALIYLHAAAQTWYAQHRLYWTPRPLALDAPDTVFSEARAMAHTFHLASTIGDRQARHATLNGS